MMFDGIHIHHAEYLHVIKECVPYESAIETYTCCNLLSYNSDNSNKEQCFQTQCSHQSPNGISLLLLKKESVISLGIKISILHHALVTFRIQKV